MDNETSKRHDVDQLDHAETLALVFAERRAARSARLSELTALSHRHDDVYWVFDLQQGDGGKGAVVDWIARYFSVAMRCQGGDNAGHTTVFRRGDGYETLHLHLLPSGLRHPHVIGLLGGGVLVNLETVTNEMRSLGMDLRERFRISDRAHLILPFHRKVDGLREDRLAQSGQQIGTTRRGVGPACVSKAARIGLRMCDLTRDDASFRAKLEQNIEFFKLPSAEVESNLEWALRLKDEVVEYIDNTDHLLSAVFGEHGSVVVEGAQGALIDLESGTYPFVTSTMTQQSSVSAGGGISFDKVNGRIGVLKAYQTMVGEGPFVSEGDAEEVELLRRIGDEFERTELLSRPRRCGWLDLVGAKWSADANACNGVVLTKLDILAKLEEFKVCVAYEEASRNNGIQVDYYPNLAQWDSLVPVFKKFKAWDPEELAVSDYANLPGNAQSFIDFVEQYLGVPVVAVRVGPRESDMIVRKDALLGKFLDAAGQD